MVRSGWFGSLTSAHWVEGLDVNGCHEGRRRMAGDTQAVSGDKEDNARRREGWEEGGRQTQDNVIQVRIIHA